MKYIYNPVTNDLDEIEKIPDLEDRLEKGIADKEARDSGWKDTKELEDYLSRDTSGSKGAWDKYVKETAHNEKVDKEIEVDKRDSLSYMNVKSVEEGEEWYRQNFPKVPDELYAIMARWNWGDLQDVTKKSIKNDKKRISKGKKPKSVAMTSKQGKFIVEF